MIFGKVAGTIVCNTKKDGIDGGRYLLIEKTNPAGIGKNDFLVALDILGANREEMVLITEGSPSRETPVTTNKPCDCLVVGIIDMVDENERVIYRK